MKTWSVQDAKARFSEMLETCLADGPQTITRRGEAAAVVVPFGVWRRMQESARPTLKDLLLHDGARADLVIPPRGRHRRRATAGGPD